MSPTSADPALSRAELRRYSRPLLVAEWAGAGAQERLKASRVLVVGAGGLGGPVVQQLTGAGVGHLCICDPDHVSLSNLHRQHLFSGADVGRNKAEVACARAQSLNPFVQVEARGAFKADWVQEFDLTIDATDNFEARYAIADACTSAGQHWVWGAASGTSGMLSIFGPELGLRDLFPTPDDSQSCSETGVLGPVPSLVGQMMALEALKWLGQVGEPLLGRLWTFDALNGRVSIIKLH